MEVIEKGGRKESVHSVELSLDTQSIWLPLAPRWSPGVGKSDGDAAPAALDDSRRCGAAASRVTCRKGNIACNRVVHCLASKAASTLLPAWTVLAEASDMVDAVSELLL